MALLGSFKGVPAAAKRLYLNEFPGTHVLILGKCTEGKNANSGRTYFAADLIVESSTNPGLAVGSKASWYREDTGYQYLQREVKAFLASAFGVQDADSIEDFDQAYEAIIAGKIDQELRVQCTVQERTKKKKTGETLTVTECMFSVAQPK